MMRWVAFWIVAGTALLSVGRFVGFARDPDPTPAGPESETIERGKTLYESKCAVCHGPQGKGDGSAAYLLFPKPRDFTRGVFKVRSTMTLPTDEDLFRVISNGMPGTSMPSWSHLPEADRWALVAYVKKLAGLEGQAPGPPIEIPVPPPPSPELIDTGRQLYSQLGCHNCHGPTGQGDGPSAAFLKDEWGYPIVPYDFTVPGRMKGGSTVRDVYRTLRVGIGGTPMPSYAAVLDETKTWALAYYVLSLAKRVTPEPAPQESRTIIARFIRGRIPNDPLAPAWGQVPAYRIRLMPLWARKEWTETLGVKALYDDKTIAFLLEWDDPLPDQQAIRPQDFTDGVALQFPVPGTSLSSSEPAFTMGDSQGLVNIWYWRSDWEADTQKFKDVDDVYKDMYTDLYPFQKDVPPASRGDLPAKARVASFESTYLPGRAAGNPFSIPLRPSSVQDLNALGFGTLTPQPADDQDVAGRGIWRHGKWFVVMVRKLRTTSGQDVQFRPGMTIPVAFAVWDGQKGDRDGQKSVSTWYYLELEKTR